MRQGLYGLAFLLVITAGFAQTNEPAAELRSLRESMGQTDARLTRQMNELLWRHALEDVAVIDKVRFTGPPPRGTNNLPVPAGSNDVVVSALTFMPSQHGHTRKLPLIVFAHGEI